MHGPESAGHSALLDGEDVLKRVVSRHFFTMVVIDSVAIEATGAHAATDAEKDCVK